MGDILSLERFQVHPNGKSRLERVTFTTAKDLETRVYDARNLRQ